MIEQYETEALSHERTRQCSSTCYISQSHLTFTNMDEDPRVEILMCSSTPGQGKSAWLELGNSMQSIKQSTQHSLDTTRAGGHEKPEVLMEENNLTWETSFTVQGIYYSPRAWENGYDIKKAQSLVLC